MLLALGWSLCYGQYYLACSLDHFFR